MLMLSSCVPNQDDNGDFLHGVEFDPTTDTGTGGNSTIKNIKKVTTVDVDGEVIIATYNYTNNKLTSITSNDNSFTYNISYSGDQISKIVYKTIDDTGADATDTQNLTYSGGNLVKSEGSATSAGAVFQKSSTNYTYNSNKIKQIITVINDESNAVKLFTIQTDYTFSGNNVSSMKYTLTAEPQGPITVEPIILNAGYSNYDTNKNPYNNIPTAFKVFSSQFDLSNGFAIGLAVNNAKTFKLTSNVESLTANFLYSYDSDGYPIIGTSSQGTIAYEYVK